MDSDSVIKVKKSIKEAKKSLQEKDYQAALEHCQIALKIEPRNYNALVFKALALQETKALKQAEETFKNAIEIEPEQLLAWKGLTGYYEKNQSPENDNKLVLVYKSIASLHKDDPDKYLDIISKLIALAKATGNSKECIEAMTLLADYHFDKKDERAEFCAWTTLINYALTLNDFKQYQNTLHKAFDRALTTSKEARISINELNALRKQQLNFYKMNRSVSEIFELAKSYLTETENDPEWIEFILKLFCENSLISNEENDDDIIDKSEIKELALLYRENPNSKKVVGLADLTLGVLEFCEKQFAKSLPLISKCISENPNLIEAWVYLSKIHLNLHNYKEAESACISILQTLAKSKSEKTDDTVLLVTLLCLNLSGSLLGLNRIKDAKQTLQKARVKCENMRDFRFEKIEIEFKLYEAKIAIEENNLEQAASVSDELEKINPHDSYVLKAKIDLKKPNYVEAEKWINMALEIKETAESLHLLSVIQWDYGLNRSVAIQNILKACKADPYYGRNYLYLGHFYKLQSNLSRAQQCYSKAFELDPYNEKIALNLSDILLEVQKNKEPKDETSKHLTILKQMTVHQPRLHWVWFRLGLCYLKMGPKYLTIAIQSLQNAIRIDPNDSKSWECLGDAYLLQGSYGASLKAFNKLVQLKPDDIYSLFQVAKNKQLLELHIEALEDYKNILNLDSNYFPAFLGLAECHYSLAKNYFNESLYGLSKDHAMEALIFLNTRVLTIKKNYMAPYKLAGDLTILLASLGSNHLPIEFPVQIYGLPKKETDYGLLDLLTSANCCYGQALSLKPKLHSLWLDLGLTYYRISQYHYENDAPIAKRIAEKCLACLKKALELNPTEPNHWLALGVVSATSDIKNGLEFAQNCFMKTLQLDPKNVTAWSNLGVLYLTQNNVELANDAFSRGQSVDPANETPWIGQALIAENVNHYQTLELFRHSSILNPKTEGVMGYAHWLISTLVDVETKKERNTEYTKRWITQAEDSLIKLTTSEKNKAEAYHYLALVLERQNLYQPAVRAAKTSYKLLKDTGAPLEQLEASKANLGRLLRLAGNTDESLSILTEIKNPDVSIYCETALSFLATGSPEKAYQAYELGLKACESSCPNLEADLLTAMAFVIRKVPGFEEQAKTLLFKSVTCDVQSIPGLLALCALGFLNSDSVLINAALSELESYKYDQRYWPKIAHLLALNKAIQGDIPGAIRQLTKAAHWQPDSHELWTHLCSFLLLSGVKRAQEAVQCAKYAGIHSSKSSNSLVQTLTMANSYLAMNDVKSSRSLALKAVHRQPDDLKSWCCLLATTTSYPDKYSSLESIYKCIEKLRDKYFETNSTSSELSLQDWIEAMLIYNNLNNPSDSRCLNKPSQPNSQSMQRNTYIATQLSQAIATEKGSASYLKNLLNEDPSLLSEFLVWSTLIRSRLNAAQYKEAEEELCLWLQVLENGETSQEEKIVPLLYLSLLAKEAGHVYKGDSEHWTQLGKEACIQAINLNKQCYVAHFLLSLTALDNDPSSKTACKSLENSLFQIKEREETVLSFTSAARKLLLSIYKSGKTDKNNFQKLLNNARMSGDLETVRHLVEIMETKEN